MIIAKLLHKVKEDRELRQAIVRAYIKPQKDMRCIRSRQDSIDFMYIHPFKVDIKSTLYSGETFELNVITDVRLTWEIGENEKILLKIEHFTDDIPDCKIEDFTRKFEHKPFEDYVQSHFAKVLSTDIDEKELDHIRVSYGDNGYDIKKYSDISYYPMFG